MVWLGTYESIYYGNIRFRKDSSWSILSFLLLYQFCPTLLFFHFVQSKEEIEIRSTLLWLLTACGTSNMEEVKFRGMHKIRTLNNRKLSLVFF